MWVQFQRYTSNSGVVLLFFLGCFCFPSACSIPLHPYPYGALHVTSNTVKRHACMGAAYSCAIRWYFERAGGQSFALEIGWNLPAVSCVLCLACQKLYTKYEVLVPTKQGSGLF